MTKVIHLFCLALVFVFFMIGLSKADDGEDEYFFELPSFEVFSNNVKVVNGITGKKYEGKHPVVLGFRRKFDDILLRYHKQLLLGEHRKVLTHLKAQKPMISRLNSLAESFGFDGEIKPGSGRLTRELSIIKRMIKDPFFQIDELVVWDRNDLRLRGNSLPRNKYAKHIRLNEATGDWERRIIARWNVSFMRTLSNGNKHLFSTFKLQGLNLDTNEGFHFPNSGILGNTPPHAFGDVSLEYPIVVGAAMNVDEQVEELVHDLVENLYYIYDPFSWQARDSTRFRYGYAQETKKLVSAQYINVNDRRWFDHVLAVFLNDVAVLDYWDPDVIYRKQVAAATKKDRNILGEDLDLLNWHKSERRSVDYDLTTPYRAPVVNFNSAAGCRYLLLDAYRRYGDKVVEAIRARVLAIKDGETVNSKQLVRDSLEEASGVPAEKYIPAAIRAQEAVFASYLKE